MTRIWWILTQALESLKNFHFNWFLLLEVYNAWSRKVQRSYEDLANFHQRTWKCQNWDFDRILLYKTENPWAKNLQRIYVYWLKNMIQNLKRNWLVASKLTWGIWRILTRALETLKNLHFNGLFVTKLYNIWAKKVQWTYLSWYWRLMQIWNKNWLVV